MLHSSLRRCVAVGGVAATLLGGVVFSQSATSQSAIPALGSREFAFLAMGADWMDPPPGNGHGPIKPDPAHPFRGNLQGGQATLRIGDSKDPVLKPWAAKLILDSNEEALTGKRAVPFAAQARCYPGGVPGQLLYPAEPFYFIQTPKVVYMIWQRDHMVRRIFMTDRHSAKLKPSWFGESIGRYENGELVVDTIGLLGAPKLSFLDNFRTPHTEKLHVVERFKLMADGGLEAIARVEDPDTFNEPLTMMQRWRRVPNPLLETVCAENNIDPFDHNLHAIPESTKPDF